MTDRVISIFPIAEHLIIIEAVFNWCINTIKGNAILFTLFVASLVLIGFKIFKRAKISARS